MPVQSHVSLPGSRRSLLPGSRVVGLARADEDVEITVKVRRKAKLPPLDARPAKPLGRAESSAAYGANEADLKAVSDVLQPYGLKTLREDQATRSVELIGPVSALEAAFEVKLFRYAHDQGGYRGRSGLVHVPKKLEGIVEAVYGLDDRKVLRRWRRAPAQELRLAAAGAAHSGFFPAELADYYQFPPGTGKGQSIGVLEFGGGYLPDDLQQFCSLAGVAVPNVIPISVHRAPTNRDNEAAIEVMLDIEVVAGLCPEATIPVYFGPSLSERSVVIVIDAAIHDATNNPTVLSMSWGDFEESQTWSDGTLDQVDDAFHEAAMMGITICVSAGDDGSDDGAGDGRAHVDFPSSSQYALAIGGTDLRLGPGSATEVVWKDGDGRRPSIGGTGGATGGGVSAHFRRPAFQSDIIIASVNRGAIVGRVVPDVAAHAQTDAVTTGYIFVVHGKPHLNGGTSASAPLWAGLIGRLNAALEAAKGTPDARAGYLTPVLYQRGANGVALGAQTSNDITTGNNVSAVVGGYQAQTGYDAVSGWGSPIGARLLAALLNVV